MVEFGRYVPRVSRRTGMGLSATALLAIGIAGGAGAVSLTRPAVEMAPTVPTAIARLPQTSGIVTVRGRVAAIYGDRFLVRDSSGQALVSAGRDGQGAVSAGSAVMVQGRYDNGQLHASYLVDPQGRVEAVGGPPPPPPHGAPPPPPPGAGAAPPPPGANGAAPPPPPPPPGAAGTAPVPPPPPPGVNGAAPPPPAPAPGATQITVPAGTQPPVRG